MCHHLFIPLLEESRVAHDQTETRPRSRQPDERTNERDRARVGQSDLRRAAERSNDKLRKGRHETRIHIAPYRTS